MQKSSEEPCIRTLEMKVNNNDRNVGRSRALCVSEIAYSSISEAIEHLRTQISDPRLSSKSLANMIKMISDRLCRGWTPEQAFGFEAPPPCAEKAKRHPILCAGTLYPSETALAAAFNIPFKILSQRLHRDGWPAEAAVNLTPPPKLLQLDERLTGIIYLWRHKVSGKAYVGLTIHEPRRMWQHVAASKASAAKLGSFQHAIATDGMDAFDYVILEENVPAVELPNRERFWIAELGTLRPHGYNQNRGGVFGGYGGIIIIDGITYLGLARLAEAVGITPSTIMSRMRKGWTPAQAAGLHERPSSIRYRIQMDLAGQELKFPTLKDACKYLGLKRKPVERWKAATKQSWEHALHEIYRRKILDSMEKFATFPVCKRPIGLQRAAAEPDRR